MSFIISISVIPFIVFVIRYTVGYIHFKYFEDFLDFFVKGRYYRNERSFNMVDLLNLAVFRNTRYAAFILVYYCVKFLRGERFKVSPLLVLKKLVVRLLLGYGFSTLDGARTITLSVVRSKLYFPMTLPGDFFYAVYTDERSLYNISIKLRMYKKDGEIFLNPPSPRKIIEVSEEMSPLQKRAVEVISRARVGGKPFHHYGIKEVDGDGSQTVIQATSKPLNGMKGF